MIQSISELGGTYSSAMNRQCTHLVIGNPNPDTNSDPLDSKKLQWAMNHNLTTHENREKLHRATRLWARAGRQGPNPATQFEDPGREIKIVWEGWFHDCLAFQGKFNEDHWDVEKYLSPPNPNESYKVKGKSSKEDERGLDDD